jgi:hypothetical protein
LRSPPAPRPGHAGGVVDPVPQRSLQLAQVGIALAVLALAVLAILGAISTTSLKKADREVALAKSSLPRPAVSHLSRR